jgi:hypothetical protein
MVTILSFVANSKPALFLDLRWTACWPVCGRGLDEGDLEAALETGSGMSVDDVDVNVNCSIEDDSFESTVTADNEEDEGEGS